MSGYLRTRALCVLVPVRACVRVRMRACVRMRARGRGLCVCACARACLYRSVCALCMCACSCLCVYACARAHVENSYPAQFSWIRLDAHGQTQSSRLLKFFLNLSVALEQIHKSYKQN